MKARKPRPAWQRNIQHNVKAKRRRETGNPSGDPVKTFIIGDEQWVLAYRDQNKDYVNLKLYAIGHVTANANYWIGFNTKSWRITHNDSMALLSENRPELYSLTVEYLQVRYGVSGTPVKANLPSSLGGIV